MNWTRWKAKNKRGLGVDRWELSKRIGREIVKRRESLKINQIELAKKLNVSPPYVCSLEKGNRIFTAHCVWSFEQVLGPIWRDFKHD